MDLTFRPLTCDAHGYFADVLDPSGTRRFSVAAHAYQQIGGAWAPKVGPGSYTCMRGQHQIENGPNGQPGPLFETFEITGVTGHVGILFHLGNWPQIDSEGCALCGSSIGILNGLPAVVGSGIAFATFMALQIGQPSFSLTVLPR